MLDVFFTVDVEIWCGGWDQIDRKFPDAFQRYVYGRTPAGIFGLPYMLEQLEDNGLTGVFFVEPLFAARFGIAPLAEIVGLIDRRRHEVQLHVHPEWADEAVDPLIENHTHKKQYMKQFIRAEQEVLIAKGLGLLAQAGVSGINAFRAGGFGFNVETLRALASNGIRFDSSYNARRLGLESGLMPELTVVEPTEHVGVFEYPVTAFRDWTGRLRSVQLAGSTYAEIETLLWQALETKRKAFVIVSHNFELLNEAKSRHDPFVVRRLRKLLRFLDRNRDCFRTRGFQQLRGVHVSVQPAPLRSSLWKTAHRVLEQALRRAYA